MLLVEDLLLLPTSAATGKLSVSSSQVDVARGGANLIELTLLWRIREREGWKPAAVIGPQGKGTAGPPCSTR